MRYHGIPGGGFGPFGAPTRPSSDRDNLDLTIRPLSTRTNGRRGHSIPTPIWRSVRLGAVGASIRRHDVSGTGWQTVGLVMQSTTTMMPVWQCGHARKDRPVSAA